MTTARELTIAATKDHFRDARGYYQQAFDIIKSVDPGVLPTMHTRGDIDMLPDEFLHNDKLDFYIYQASHALETQDRAYKCAQTYYHAPVKRPIISAEVCYEGHGHADQYGRYGAFDVRKAMWQSVLAGAKAGVAYGAHGLWGLHRKGAAFNNERYSSLPFYWRTALRFPGAWDAGFIRWIFEQYDLFGIEPVDVVRNEDPAKRAEIRVSMTPDGGKLALYMPYSAELLLDVELAAYDLTLIDLSERRFARPVVREQANLSVLDMHGFNADVLVIGRRIGAPRPAEG